MNETELAPFLHYAKGSKIAGIVIALVCFGIASLGFVDDSATLGIQLGLAIPFTGIAIFMLYVGFRPADRHPVIVILRDRANEVVWVHAQRQFVNGVHSQTFINVGLASGKTKGLAIGPKTDPTPLLGRLQASLPRATYGYSPELQAQFKKNPASLRT